MAFDTVYKPMTVSDIIELYKEGKIRFDLAIQRNEVWDDDRATLFLHSVLYGYPFPPVYTMDGRDVMNEIDNPQGDEENYLWVLDGKQRLTRIIKFVLNEWILSEEMPEIDGEDLSNMNFDNLPEKFKRKILNTQFTVFQFRGMTLEEVEETFYRLNMGAPLSRQEINRVRGGIEVLRLLDKYKNMDFFVNKLNMSKKMKNRFMDEELLLQMMMLLVKEENIKGFDKKSIEDFIIELRDHSLTNEQEEWLGKVLQYLNSVAELMEEKVRKKAFKKVHVPTLALLAKEAIEHNDDEFLFAQWATMFFESIPSEYSELTKQGSAKPQRIIGRLHTIQQSYRRFKEIAKARV